MPEASIADVDIPISIFLEQLCDIVGPRYISSRMLAAVQSF